MEKEIKKILKELGIKLHISGFQFWIDLVECKINTTEKSITKLYGQVADIHKTTASRVERALRHAIEDKHKEIQKYFRINYEITNSAFLYLILDELEG